MINSNDDGDDPNWVAADDSVRKEIARRARDRRKRKAAFSKERPIDWSPHNVLSPKSGFPLSDNDAWHLIAEFIESGHPIEKIKLTQPAGETGYVMLIDGFNKEPQIYVKLQLFGDYVLARSFHRSIR